MISLYASHEKIYPRSVSGLFSNWRWGMVFLTQLVFYGIPWLEWGQRQAVLFDLGTRRFYIFGLVLYPQDFIYLTGILVISALSLFLFTAVAGRLWCGYACPQTVYTEIFLWIEKKVEGDRSARMRRDAQPLSIDKFFRKTWKSDSENISFLVAKDGKIIYEKYQGTADKKRNINMNGTLFFKTDFDGFFNKRKIFFVCVYLIVFQQLKISVRMLLIKIFLSNRLSIKNIYKIGRSVCS